MRVLAAQVGVLLAAVFFAGLATFIYKRRAMAVLNDQLVRLCCAISSRIQQRELGGWAQRPCCASPAGRATPLDDSRQHSWPCC